MSDLEVEPMSTASAVLMIRPKHFGLNAETAASNRFQAPRAGAAAGDPARSAEREFDALADTLRRAGIAVLAVEGRDEPSCPDEVFPNNWLSTHRDGTVVLYPMMAPSRRRERRADIADTLRGAGYGVRRVVDLTELETRGLYLEGTGSLVLDRASRIAYACRSARTSADAVRVFADRMHYDAVVFDADDRDGHPIYHTNVLMSVGSAFALICADAIRDPAQRAQVLDRLTASGKRIIEIGHAQLHAFAGNLLELRGDAPTIVLSQRALDSLDSPSRNALAEHGRLVSTPIDTIETFGGGSVRCMLAEIFLPA